MKPQAHRAGGGRIDWRLVLGCLERLVLAIVISLGLWALVIMLIVVLGAGVRL